MLFNKFALATLAGAIASVSAQTKFDFGTASTSMIGVVARENNGPTNPKAPSLGTAINQTSEARLVSVNSVDDWCTFSSPNGQNISDVEGITVAFCTQARNNARVIPDGTLTAVHFVKTPLYVQIMALGDFTKIGMAEGDEGGELDPHGATNMGNPIGGNVTSNVSGSDVFYEEWMNYISYNQVCIRVCIAGSDVAPTPLECQHTLDEMGCNFVMPGNYNDNSFDSCDADSAWPPGLYPEGSGDTSTFQQYYSSVYTAGGGQVYTFVNGSPDESTPQAAYSTPASSNCISTSTISNGIKAIIPTTSTTMASSTAGSASTSAAGSSGTGSTSGSSSGSGSDTSSSSTTTSGSSSSSSMSIMVIGSIASLALAALFL